MLTNYILCEFIRHFTAAIYDGSAEPFVEHFASGVHSEDHREGHLGMDNFRSQTLSADGVALNNDIQSDYGRKLTEQVRG